MSASDHLANELVDHLLGAAYTAPSIYVSLHSGDPGTTGANELSTAVGDYDRKLHSSWNAASSGDATNNGATTFTQATADWATATSHRRPRTSGPGTHSLPATSSPEGNSPQRRQ